MSPQGGDDPRAALRRTAEELLGRLTPAEREALLLKNWMSHDARWFMAVAREFGMAAVNRVNRIAARELGRVEAQRVVRALGLAPPRSRDDYLLLQEVLIGLFGPDLLDYGVTRVGDDVLRVDVRRCFAYDNAVRAGITDTFECGIFERVLGWLDAFGLEVHIDPPLGRCLKALGRDCGYTITFPKPAG